MKRWIRRTFRQIARAWARWRRRPGPLLESEYGSLRPRELPSWWEVTASGDDGYLFRNKMDGLSVIWGGGVEEDKNRWVWAMVGKRNRRPTWDEVATVRRLFLPRHVRVVLLMPPVGRENLGTALLLACIDVPTIPALRRMIPKEE